MKKTFFTLALACTCLLTACGGGETNKKDEKTAETEKSADKEKEKEKEKEAPKDAQKEPEKPKVEKVDDDVSEP
jgi:protein involved in sex pheromone biosynthesis